MTNDEKNRYLKIKRALFERANSDLNDRQKESVFTVNGPLLVIAGAGSGKTTVLVRRIAQIIKYGNAYADESVPEYITPEMLTAYEAALNFPPEAIKPILDDFITPTSAPCPPWSMLAITFTNKAANEIKERLTGMFDDPDVAKDIWAGTFHSVCMRILRRSAHVLGYKGELTIYDTDDTKKLVSQVMKDMNIDEKAFPIKTVAGEISRAKEKLLDPAAYAAEAKNSYREKIYANIYEEYQKRLKDSGALDFDDIIMKTVELFDRDPETLRHFAGMFRYVCVDEYQDTNHAQFELCRRLASGHGNIMVVGDDDQSIYRFRGATIENILSFDSTYPAARVIKLEQNYRSTKTILEAANAVIGKNTGRRKKVLWTENDAGADIVLEECDNENGEARRIADTILKAVAEKKYTYRDFAVLYRVNAQSNAIERTFAKSAIPYRVCGGLRFMDRKEIRDVTAYLQVINNHSDRIRLRRIINEPKRKIGENTLAAVEAIADEQNISVFDVMKNAGEYAALSRAASVLIAFTDVIEKLTSMYSDGCPLDALVNNMLDLTGYRKMLEAAGEAEKDRLDNVEEFISGVVEYMNNNEEPTLTGFLEENALVADVDKYDENADAVVMMTVHSAKGLEFPVAFLPGMEEGIFPGTQSLMDPAEMEEERRLAYVAITRAKKELVILHTNYRMLYGKTAHNSVSRFVQDIPAELIDDRTPVRYGAGMSTDPYGDYADRPRTYISGGTAVGSSTERPRRNGSFVSAIPSRPRAAVETDKLTVTRPVQAPAARTKETFVPGDRVRHQAFGVGEVLSVKPMGSDCLYEVMFDSVGTKKLMATYAKLTKAE